MKFKNQIAKEFHVKLVEQGLIDEFYEGLLGDNVWISKNSRAHMLTDLASIHLRNIVEKFRREGKEIPTPIQSELERRIRENSDTRVFFVTNSITENEEIFETLAEARNHTSKMQSNTGRRIRVCLVRNAYKERQSWNYDDRWDTFTDIELIEEEV